MEVKMYSQWSRRGVSNVRIVLAIFLIISFSGTAFPGPAVKSADFAPDEVPFSSGSHVRISQIYGGGGNSGATYTHDFIELFNPADTAVDLSGWSVQYASATGATWQITGLSGAIPAKSYYLIQQAQGSGGTTPLPTPDASGTIAMAAANGKVALTNSATALSGYCPTGTQIIDFVGYGNANCFEGSGATPALGNTTAAIRLGDGCTDNDNNAGDFVAGAPVPRNSSSPSKDCSADIVITKSGPAKALAGGIIEYTLMVTNNGFPVAGDLVVTDIFPEGTSYLSDTSGITPNEPVTGTFVWELDDLETDNSFTFTIKAAISNDLLASTVLINQAEVESSVSETNLTNNVAQWETEILGITPIVDVRAGTQGDWYAVEGSLTVEPRMYNAYEWVVQDGTGGIAIYNIPAPAVGLGEFVQVIGKLGMFNGQEQLTNLEYVEKVSGGVEVEPILVTTSEVSSGATEGWLVQVTGVATNLGTCTGNYSFTVNDGSGPADIFINSYSGVNVCAMGVENGSLVRITGFSTEYTSGSYPTIYQVKARRTADVVLIPNDVIIHKYGPAIVAPGEVFTYNLVVENYLGIDLEEVVVGDFLPDNVTYVSGGDYDEENRLATWSFPSLAHADSVVVQLSVQAPDEAGDYILNELYGVVADNYPEPARGPVVVTAVDERVRIHYIQGFGDVSSFVNQPVEEVFGVITFIHNQGFFMQEPNPDTYEETSEGIFVLTNTEPSLMVGDAITVTGYVIENKGMTSIKLPTWITGTTEYIIDPTPISLPAETSLERYEGMLVSINQTLTASQNYFQGRYGQVTLSADGRMFNPTNGNGLGDTAELNLRRMIVLDDGTEAENVYPIPYIGEDDTLRAGDTVSGLVGVIDYGVITSGGLLHYRLHPVEEVLFNRDHPRPETPEAVGGSLKVASFNVLNYFNGNGQGGGFPTPRGATTLIEFERQRTKIINAIIALDSDVVGLMEMERDGTGEFSAIQDLVNGLNAATAPGTYQFIAEPAPGTDAIKVSMIYRPAAVTPVGEALNYQVTDHPLYQPLFDRPPLGQVFEDNATGENFSVIVNHLKSKGSCPVTGLDADQGDGQACWNAKRVEQALGLIDFAAILGEIDADVMIIGDLNAYGIEDPIIALTSTGFSDEVAKHVTAEERYTYVFDGQSGYLDHILSTPSMSGQITGVTIWKINADEPSVIDYTTSFKSQDFYTPTPYRSSDHDPIIVGLELQPLKPATLTIEKEVIIAEKPVKPGDAITYKITVTNKGDVDAVDVRIIDNLPEGIIGEDVDVTVTIEARGSYVITIPVTVSEDVPYGSIIKNTATFSHVSGDGMAKVSLKIMDLNQIYLPMIFKAAGG
jgi:uncharacterized repeat protein (TIGR01451 family)